MTLFLRLYQKSLKFIVYDMLLSKRVMYVDIKFKSSFHDLDKFPLYN